MRPREHLFAWLAVGALGWTRVIAASWIVLACRGHTDVSGNGADGLADASSGGGGGSFGGASGAGSTRGSGGAPVNAGGAASSGSASNTGGENIGTGATATGKGGSPNSGGTTNSGGRPGGGGRPGTGGLSGSGGAPAPGDFPSQSNTGIPAHTTLTPMPTVAIADGTIIDGADISDNFTVSANNVTIRNSRIRGNGYWIVKFAEGHSGLTIEDTEITRLNSCSSDTKVSCFADYGIIDDGDNLTVTRVSIHNVTSGIHLGSNATIQDSYIWNLVNISGKDHNDDIITNGGSVNLVISHNTLEVQGTQTTPVALYDETRVGGPCAGVLVDNNLISGGGFCLYMGPTNTSIHVTSNHFDRKFYPQCGAYGVSHDSLPSTPGNLWSGNVWHDTKAVVPQP